MPNKFKVGDTVLMPRARLGLSLDTQSAFYRTTVKQAQERSIKVDLPGGGLSGWIGSSVAHSSIGICIVRIGDLATEVGLLDPLSKSVLQYFRLLISDDMVDLIEIRSKKELEHYWGKQHAKYSHVVLIGHGRSTEIKVGIDGWLPPQELSGVFSAPEPERKLFVSLCCETGRRDFAREFSLASCCQSFVGPFRSVHGGIASQFCQAYYAHHVLDGRSSKVAFNKANKGLPGGGRFKCWQDGALAQ